MLRNKLLKIFFTFVMFFSIKNYVLAEGGFTYNGQKENSGLLECLGIDPDASGNAIISTSKSESITCENKVFTPNDMENLKNMTDLKSITLNGVTLEGDLVLNGVNNINLVNVKVPSIEVSNFKNLTIRETSNNINSLKATSGDDISVFKSKFDRVELGSINTSVLLEENEISHLLLTGTNIRQQIYNNTILSYIEANDAKKLDLKTNKGIEEFHYTGVEELILENNQFSSKVFQLNGISNNIVIQDNNLEQIISNSGNKVTGELVIDESNLQELRLSNAIINKLNVGQNSLRQIIFDSSQISNLRLTRTNKLSEMIVDRSIIESELIIESAEELEHLRIETSEVGGFALVNTPNLLELIITNSKIPFLHLEGAPNLRTLDISQTSLKNLDLSNNKLLEILVLRDNELNFIDLSNNNNLKKLIITNNNLTSLNLSGKEVLKDLILYPNLWNTNGKAISSTTVKPKEEIVFTELLVLPKKLLEGATFSGKQNKKYTSSDSSIATVDKDGKIKALKEGEVTITLEYTITTVIDSKEVTHTYYETNKIKVDKEETVWEKFIRLFKENDKLKQFGTDKISYTNDDNKFVITLNLENNTYTTQYNFKDGIVSYVSEDSKTEEEKYIDSYFNQVALETYTKIFNYKYDDFIKYIKENPELTLDKNNFEFSIGKIYLTEEKETSLGIISGDYFNVLKFSLLDGIKEYEKLNNIDNPKTGFKMNYGILTLLLVIFSTAYLLIRKYSKFPKHN